MKSYIIGAVVLLCGIVFASATVVGEKAPESPQVEEALYWYPVVGGDIDHTQPINNTPLTKSQLRSASMLECNELPGPDCIRGFFDPQTEESTDTKVDQATQSE